jgi:hypothetical protein
MARFMPTLAVLSAGNSSSELTASKSIQNYVLVDRE